MSGCGELVLILRKATVGKETDRLGPQRPMGFEKPKTKPNKQTKDLHVLLGGQHLMMTWWKMGPLALTLMISVHILRTLTV